MADGKNNVNCWVRENLQWPATGTGSLDGLSVALKDLFELPGHTSSFGHPAWRDSHSPGTTIAPVVSTLLAAGASVEGLAKLDQLAYSLIGNVGEDEPPCNPCYPDRFTGGSSSGSAAAVAAGLADIGLGTDTAGSIRVPAAACGLAGLRPTYGSLDARGVLPLAPSFDTVGLLARDPEVLGRTLDVLLDVPAPPIRALRLAADCLDSVDTDIAYAVRRAAAMLARDLGVNLLEGEFAEFTSVESAALFARMQAREIWAEHGAWVAEHGSQLAAEVQERLAVAERLSPSQEEAEADRKAWVTYRERYADYAEAGVITVLPVLPTLPPLRESTSDALKEFRLATFRLTTPGSLSGSPQLVLPVRHTASGNTFGVGFLGVPGGDRTLCSLLATPLVLSRS